MATDVPQVATYDYALFGEVERRPLSRIRSLISRQVSASWAAVPHVAQFEEVDVSALEALRQRLQPAAEAAGLHLSMLPLVLKACAEALAAFPEVNASLDETGRTLVLKKYCHIAFAADTPVGLLAPVVRDVDRRGLFDVAAAAVTLAEQARNGRLALADTEGGCFTVSNLGALGGTGFIPIVRAPEVAILGMGCVRPRVIEVDGHFESRPHLPLSFVYDHRVIDGVLGARFLAHLRERLLAPDTLGEST